MKNVRPVRYLLLCAHPGPDVMLLDRRRGAQVYATDVDDLPLFITEQAQELGGLTVFEGRQGELEEEDFSEHSTLVNAVDRDLVGVGDEWWEGKVRRARLADMADLLGEAPEARPAVTIHRPSVSAGWGVTVHDKAVEDLTAVSLFR